MSTNSFFRDSLERFAANESIPAFHLFDGRNTKELSFGDFRRDILEAAGTLASKKIRGQHIALLAPSDYHWCVSLYAIFVSGNVAVPMNAALTDDMLLRQCALTEANYICGDLQAIPECIKAKYTDKLLDYKALKGASPFSMEEIFCAEDKDTVALMLTSGTSGKSKAVELSAENISSGIRETAEFYHSPQCTRVLVFFPYYHMAGFNSVLLYLWNCEALCIGRGFKYAFFDMPALNPTTISVVPTMLATISKLVERADSKEKTFSFFGKNLQRIVCAGAKFSPAVFAKIHAFGIDINNAYGMTETMGNGAWICLDEKHLNSIGKISGAVEGKIENGEILLRGPAVMKGYYHNPEETAEVMDGEWIRTGDMGYWDEDGYCYITGRKKNIIILSNGENINPEEIEETLSKCPDILEVLIYDDDTGICADVYTEKEDIAASFIKGYNRDTPTYRQVYKVNYQAEPLEKTGSGKIKRKEKS